MACKGTCDRYKAKKPLVGGRYENGQHRCQICEIFMTWEGLWCPCCGYRLRTKPRNKKYKAKLDAVTPRGGKNWEVFEEMNSGGKITMVSNGEATLIRLINDDRTNYHLWECMLGKDTVERFICV